MAKDFPWKRLPVYWLAQYLGALVASGTVLGLYYGKYLKLKCVDITIYCYITYLTEAIATKKINGEFRINANSSDPEPGSAAIFANYPTPYSSVVTGLMEEVIIEIKLITKCVLTIVYNRFYRR